MILNQTQMSAIVSPFTGSLDLDELSRLKAEVARAGNRRIVVVIDCTSVDHFSQEALEDLLAVRRCVERLGIQKIMIAVRQPTRFGQSITRLIPAALHILRAQLPRFAAA